VQMTSRKRRGLTCVDCGVDLGQNPMMLAARREILLDFPVPRQTVLRLDECDQFREFLRRKLSHSMLYFSETHGTPIYAAGCSNATTFAPLAAGMIFQ
jgi:hypothetical protein